MPDNSVDKAIAAKNAEIKKLREAIKPFADLALWRDTYPDGPDILSSGDMMTQYITADMVRDARKATE